MNEPNPPAGKSAAPELQGLREMMALVISLVVLLLTAYMLYSTFVSAGEVVQVPGPADSASAVASTNAYYERVVKAQADAYTRQKDIMLYALALFGTVMGYYLGRAPAEANAKRAERTADAAQSQLTKTQDRLVDASASASVATAETGRVKEEKAKVDAKLNSSAKVLREASGTLSTARKARSEVARGRSTAGAAPAPSETEHDEALRRAQEAIDSALALVETPPAG